MKYVGALNSSWNSQVYFTGIALWGKFLFHKLVCYLWDAVSRKHPKKRRTNIWFLLHDNAPAHQSVLVKDFLAKNNVTTLEHQPHFPDLDPVNFYVFLWLESALKGWRFCDATDSIKSVMEELKRLSQNGFQECFQYLHSFWQKHIVPQGNYFEGNLA